jgi:hypothetical protein
MWTCEHCGCQGIASDLAFCPQCFTPRNVTTEPGQPAGGSDGSLDGSQTEGLNSPPSGDPAAAPSSPSETNFKQDWGSK